MSTTATKRIEHSAAIAAYGRAHPSDPTAKGMRARLRTFAGKVSDDHPYAKRTKNTPWPTHSLADLSKCFASDAAFLKQLSGSK
jgi:hypothetical protein